MNKETVYKLFFNMYDAGKQKITVKDNSFNIEHTCKDVISHYTIFSDSSSFVYCSIKNTEENIYVYFTLLLNNQSGIYDTINQTFNCHGNVFAVQRRFKSLQKIYYIFYGV